jgi:hypothetical protein
MPRPAYRPRAIDPENATLARLYLSWQRDVRRRRGCTLHDYACTLEKFLDFAAD